MVQRLYGAYGSNLNVDQMMRRCPNAELIGTATLKGYELLYKGSKSGAYLTIEPNPKEEVPLGIWSVDRVDEYHLDIYEGYPSFYYKKEFELEVKDYYTGRVSKQTVFIYIMDEKRRVQIPRKHYVITCSIGYMDFGFDMDILNAAYTRTKERMV